MTYYDDYLEHHGVKGMKWGVRRQRKKERKALKKASKKMAKKQKAEYYKRDSMSDAELQKRINRIRMENEYHRLSSEAVALNQSKAEAWLKGNKQLQNKAINDAYSIGKDVSKEYLKKKATKAALAAAL